MKMQTIARALAILGMVVVIIALDGSLKAYFHRRATGVGDSKQTQIKAGRLSSAITENPFHNDRLKTLGLPDAIIVGDRFSRLVSGTWLPESKDPKKELVFPKQVKIQCSRFSDRPEECVEVSVQLGTHDGMVSVEDLDNKIYKIDRWDTDGLVASYGGDDSSICQRHVLTMDFSSGAVSNSNIPTHRQGCENFIETDSYRLVRGKYYVDTTPNNDLDKQVSLAANE